MHSEMFIHNLRITTVLAVIEESKFLKHLNTMLSEPYKNEISEFVMLTDSEQYIKMRVVQLNPKNLTTLLLSTMKSTEFAPLYLEL